MTKILQHRRLIVVSQSLKNANVVFSVQVSKHLGENTLAFNCPNQSEASPNKRENFLSGIVVVTLVGLPTMIYKTNQHKI